MVEKINTILDSPVATISIGFTGFAQSFMDWTSPAIQYLILICTLVIVLNNVLSLFKKKWWKRLK
jgi:hypothetical protein